MTSSGRSFSIVIVETDPIKDTTLEVWQQSVLTGHKRDKVAASLDRAFHDILDRVVPVEE